jgi:hypothetical protein
VDRAGARGPSRSGPAFERALDTFDVAALHEEDPDAFAALAEIVSDAHYMNLKIRKRVRYPGQKSTPPYPDEAEYYLEGLLPEQSEPPPTATIAANAHRCVGHLIETASRQAVPV